MGLIVDIVELQDDMLFITGYISQTVTVGDTFKSLAVYMPAKKRKHAPKCLSKDMVSLTVVSIIADGEPLDHIPEGRVAQIGLTGDTAVVIQLVQDHHWHESNGRYLLPRKETQFIELSGD